MLTNIKWFRLAPYFRLELLQCASSGVDISAYDAQVKALQNMDADTPEAEALARELYDAFERLPAATDKTEPSQWDAIVALRKGNHQASLQLPFTEEEMMDKLYGAWLGRASGCLLGKPVEGWNHKKIEEYLKETNNFPIENYFSANISDERKKYYEFTDFPGYEKGFLENIQYMPEDDDTNYTVLGLEIVKKNGYDFTTEKVGVQWLASIPILSTCTAERVAYTNMCNRINPPETATRNNPFREYIGAQIRADFFGYAAPGNPALASQMAFNDAALTHVKNGIYGEMFVAAMLARAYETSDMLDIVKTGMDYIPQESRLYDKLELVLSWYHHGVTMEEVFAKIHEMYDEFENFDWCHTISNAMIVAISLLYGENDYEKSVRYSVMIGFDTDCNGSTVGSIVGLVLGAKAMPSKWTNPMKDTLHSGIKGYSVCNIKDLAEQSLAVIKTRYTLK